MSRPLLPLLLLVALAGITACSPKHEHATSEKSHAGHVHTAPHGGMLVELGEHRFNLELVRDPAAGSLTAYVLDGHAENFVRVALPGFELVATVEGRRETLTLAAVANPATDETVGNTSEFRGEAAWLKSAAAFEAVVPSFQIRGAVFSGTKFTVPATKGN